ncbi:MAG: histidinol-phosphate transaminase [Nitrospiraceae bacterium]|nr:histidinol-phosphate transaminase [Nitrospirota bacterium]MDA8213935.1 histidinol-phosphate transaminase [Nitrospiraceae bacterium]MDA8337796.1 histidinol-phosphate transaminase [Nitrospiraceae bacterium]
MKELKGNSAVPKNKIMPLEYVSKIKPYVPGKPVKELERELGIKGSIKLASNENPLGPSKKAVEALRKFFQNGHELSRYPDSNGYYLKSAISERLNVDSDEIILGNGSNELIDIAVRTFVGPGDEAVMATPSFVAYSIAVKSVGGIIKEVPLLDYRHDLAGIADTITDRTKIIFIANPNNPTGTINNRDEFERFMNRVPDGVLVIVDEAYYEYVMDSEYPDILNYFAGGRDILILRTFSKAYGLAGLRIGYGIARKDIITEMNKIRGPFNTNTLSQLAAMHALTDDEHLKKSIEINEQGKKFLYRELDSMGITYVPTEANFVYMPLNTDSKNIYEALLRMGVIIRTVGPREIRVTIGLPEENERFIEALKIVIKSWSN